MENQRIRLSKAMLKNALMGLLKEKPIEKISVYELCAAAQINRTTFYKYYGSQYELLTDAENDYFRKLEDVLSENASDGRDSLCRVLEALLADEAAFMTLAGLPARQGFFGQAIQPARYQDAVRYGHTRRLHGQRKSASPRLFLSGRLCAHSGMAGQQ